jgi:hypothetical protein
MPRKTDLDHFLQLRVSTATITEIDAVIATTQELSGFNRCRFIRYAVGFVLASLVGKPDSRFDRENTA